MVTDLPCFPTFANFRLGGFLFQKKASRTQAPPLVLTDGCHGELVLGFNSVLPGLFVKLGPKTNQTLIVFFPSFKCLSGNNRPPHRTPETTKQYQTVLRRLSRQLAAK